jgi:rod shape-determining protein MreC
LAALAAMIFLNAWSATNPASFAWLENSLAEFSRPVSDVLTQLTGRVNKATDYLYDLKDTQDENIRLQKQVSELKRDLANVEELRAENERLLSLLALSDTRSFDSVTVARVIAISSYAGADQFIRINKGANDGIAKDMAVVTLDGLVGRVTNVSPRTAKVMLITDPLSSVGCLSQRSRSAGITKGQGFGTIVLSELTRESDVKKGDLIVTSGLGVIFPSGIPVARVVEVEKREVGLFHAAELQTIVDFNRLEEVTIIRAKGYTAGETE